MAKTTAASMGRTTSPFQQELAWASLGIGAAALLAPFFGHEYWLAVIVAQGFFACGTAYVWFGTARTALRFALTDIPIALYIDLLVPLLLVVLYVRLAFLPGS